MKTYLKDLKKMNISDLRFVCKQVGITYNIKNSKNTLVKKLLSPLGKKYKMEKITDPRLKGKIMSFLPDDDAANFLVDRKNKLESVL